MKEPTELSEGMENGGSAAQESRTKVAAGRSSLGRARPGARGRGTRRIHPERACLNCGDSTRGQHCAACGQQKKDVLVSVRALVSDAMEDEFVINRRLPATLVHLFLHPGFLTVEYVNGRIVRYIRPFRLYLVSSVIFFLLLSFFSLRMLARAELGVDETTGTEASDTTALASIDSALAEIERVRGDGTVPLAARAALEPAAEGLQRERARNLAARDGLDTSTVDAVERPAVAASSGARTIGELLNVDTSNVQISLGAEDGVLNQAVQRRTTAVMEMTPRQAIEKLVGDFLNFIPTVMFVLLPVFALVLKLLYIRRRRYYVEHFVFLLHTHAFVYLIFSLMLVLRGTFTLPGWLILALLTWTVLYLFIAMKRMYGQAWITTFAKGWVLAWSYAILLSVSVPLVIVGSFLFL